MSGRKQEGIDRYALVHRHHPTYRQADLFAPLAVGNGEFAFTADITGLQSFPENYDVPLGTQSQWGWHSSEGNNRYQRSDLRPQMYDTYGREVGYYVDGKEQEEAFHWLRQNPHRLQLAQIGMRLLDSDGRMVSLGELTQIEQTLDLWQGMLTSRFTAGDVPVTVQTCCHPSSDQLSFRIESALLTQGRLEIAIGFPSPRQDAEAWADDVGLNWNREEDHESELTQTGGTEAVFIRTMDEDGYKVAASWSSGSIVRDGRHRFRIVPAAGTGEAAFEGTFAFSPLEKSTEPVSFAGTAEASRKHWAAFWTQGGAIDLSQSSDPRALELERRIVLSQFLTAIHCADGKTDASVKYIRGRLIGEQHQCGVMLFRFVYNSFH